MSERHDLEVRVYVTGRPGPVLEWQVVTFEDDGQSAWQDGGTFSWAPGRPMMPPELARIASLSLRRVVRQALEWGA